MIAGALIYLAATSAVLADKQEPAAIIGAGVNTCAEFAQKYRDDPDHVMLIYFSWAQGAMSNINMLQKIMKKPMRDLVGFPLTEQMDRLRNFCDKRPLAHFGDGVLELFFQFPEIKPESK